MESMQSTKPPAAPLAHPESPGSPTGTTNSPTSSCPKSNCPTSDATTSDSPKTCGAPKSTDALEYVRVARSGQVPDGVVRRFFAGGLELAVSRFEGEVHISSNYCTHLACLLSSGKVTEDGLLCSCHGSVFDYATGEPLSPPAVKPVQVYPVREENGEIFVALPLGNQDRQQP